MGNFCSVQKSFERNNSNVIVSNDHKIIMNADKIVLPGVGSFRDGMKNLSNLGLLDVLNAEVIENKKPFLGICLGMQLMANTGYEISKTKGLGWIDGEVVKFDFPENNGLKIPHVGWNNLMIKGSNLLYEGIPDNKDFYFVHSYHLKLNEDVITGMTEYGYQFVSSISKNNLYGFQFHPEKSQELGLAIINNFINL
jgi:imidazole glycerol-phosphate synthase subunit HisH